MDDIDDEAVIRHVRGATVVHQSPFNSLEVPSADVLSVEDHEKWVVPFYRVSSRLADSKTMEAEPRKGRFVVCRRDESFA